MDFGFDGNRNDNSNNTGSDVKAEGNGNITNLDTNSVDDKDINRGSNDTNDIQSTKEKLESNEDNADSKTNKLDPGTSIEVGDDTYTIDDNGNVIDKNGNIFKEANDVSSWLESFEHVEEDSDNISIDSIREAIGVDISDENDNPIEFENSVEGIKKYVNAVIDSSRQENYETAINSLYQKYPIIEEVLNYYIANGNSLDGFSESPDYSDITIEENNETQQENIIRAAWQQREQKGDIDGYINYLKSAGTLFATAQEELDAIKEYDEQYKQSVQEEAERIEQERIQALENYWNAVHDVINTRQIAGYQIPESIIINRNNQKFSVTPDDFFNYIYRVDKDGKSAYERDLEKETPESRREDEILRAYLKFVGGNYSNLVDMAINKEKVTKLKLRAKERNSSSVKINRPKPVTNIKNIDLGYN